MKTTHLRLPVPHREMGCDDAGDEAADKKDANRAQLLTAARDLVKQLTK